MQDVRLYRGWVRPEVIARLAGLSASPVAEWAFDEGTGSTATDSVAAHPATLQGATWVVDDARGVAVTMRATDAVAVDDAPELQVGKDDEDFSVTMWLKLSGGPVGSWRGVLHKGAQDLERTFAVWLLPGSNHLHARISTSPGVNEGIDATDRELPPDRWVRVAYVKAGRELVVYLDGTLAGHAALNGPSISNTGPLRVGQTPWYTGFEGAVSGLTIHRGALTFAEIVRDATGGSQPEDDYRLAAYQSLLAQQGTSYAELRMSRSATDASRTSLASRLGIDLRPSRPDELDALFAAPEQMTEAWLESELGLRDTTRDPFSNPPSPTLLTARLSALARQWEAVAQDSNKPVLDPDALTASDFANATGPATVWAARAGALAARLDALHAARAGAGPNPATIFDAVVQVGLGQPATRLDEGAVRRASGVPIDDDLAELHLTVAMFDRLVSLRALTSSGVITHDEWDELDDLLVQSYKLDRATAWLDEERVVLSGRPLVIGPDVFRLGGAEPEARSWRFDVDARRAWRDRLQMHIDQIATVHEAFWNGVRQAEVLVLPLLRDALAPAVLATLDCAEPDQVSERLLVDATDGGVAVGTRAGLAIEVMHGLLFGIRSTSFPAGHPANTWSFALREPGSPPPEETFDDEWRWMGSLDGWRAAMLVFFYPETVLIPQLRPADATVAPTLPPTGAWLNPLMKNIRSPRGLTPAAAQTLAHDYADAARGAWAAALPGQPGWVTNYTPDPDAAPAVQLAINTEVFKALAATRLQDVPSVVQEMLYFAPLAIALQLQRNGEFVTALDWFQLVYNVALPADSRKVYVGLRTESNTAPSLSRTGGWLRHINPHELAVFHGATPTRATR